MDKEKEVGCLWTRVSKNGMRYMSGKVNGQEVVAFENKKKEGKQPDWRIYKSEPRPTQPPRDDEVGF